MGRLKCRNCGQEIGEAVQCGFCGFNLQEPQVREMSRSENLGYQGVTIDENGSEEGDGTFFNESESGRHRFYVKGIQLGHSVGWGEKLMQNYWLSRLVIGVVLAGIVTVLVFIALPIALMVAAAGILAWIVLHFLGKR